MGTALLPLQFNKTSFTFPRLFSSSAVLTGRTATSSKHAPDSESAVYRRALKLQRPTTVRCQEILHNSVSLIGSINSPLRACNSEKFGLYTFLKVRTPAPTNRGFEIMLQFWNKMAQVSAQHLKLDDVVYVWGCLGSYLKLDEDGSSLRRFKVDVKEMNFVAENILELACQNPIKWEPGLSYEAMMQKQRERLHLWQVFFANPSEWWDNRKSKLNPQSPDFKHKDTGEALWITGNDPPWINQQLQLCDSRLSKRSHVRQRDAWSHLSPLVFDEGKSK